MVVVAACGRRILSMPLLHLRFASHSAHLHACLPAVKAQLTDISPYPALPSRQTQR